jgi:hypothetical protein
VRRPRKHVAMPGAEDEAVCDAPWRSRGESLVLDAKDANCQPCFHRLVQRPQLANQVAVRTIERQRNAKRIA